MWWMEIRGLLADVAIGAVGCHRGVRSFRCREGNEVEDGTGRSE